MDPSDWLPTYPDLLPPRRTPRVQDFAGPPYNTEAFPVSDVLADLTFLPTFPDRVPHLRVSREETWVTSAAITSTALAPLTWLGHYPLTVPHRRLPAGAMQEFAAPPPGYQVVVAASLAWQSHHPSSVPHRRHLQPGGSFSAIDPAIPAGEVLCLDLGLDTFTTTTLLWGALTTPTFLEEGLGSTSFLDEDLC